MELGLTNLLTVSKNSQQNCVKYRISKAVHLQNPKMFYIEAPVPDPNQSFRKRTRRRHIVWKGQSTSGAKWAVQRVLCAL